MKINTTNKQPNNLVNTKRSTAELTLSESQLANTRVVDIAVVDHTNKESRLIVTYQFQSINSNSGQKVTMWVSKTKSLQTMYFAFKWAKHEVWDMYGNFFIKHPDLRHILTVINMLLKHLATSKNPSQVNTKYNTTAVTFSALQLANTSTVVLIQGFEEINGPQEYLTSQNLLEQLFDNSQTLTEVLVSTTLTFSDVQPNTSMIFAMIITVGGIVIGGCSPREHVVPEPCVTPFPDSNEWLKPWITPIPDPNLGCKPLITPLTNRSDWWKPWTTPTHTSIFGPRGLVLHMAPGGKAAEAAAKGATVIPGRPPHLVPPIVAPLPAHGMPPHVNPAPVADTTTHAGQPHRALPVENSAPKIEDKQEHNWKNRKKTEDSYAEKIAKDGFLEFVKGFGWVAGGVTALAAAVDPDKAKESLKEIAGSGVEKGVKYLANNPQEAAKMSDASLSTPTAKAAIITHAKATGEAAAVKAATGTVNWVTELPGKVSDLVSSWWNKK